MARQSAPGLFVETTNVWEISQLQEVDIRSPEFKELLVRLYQNVNKISIALNLKDSGYYPLTEFVNSQLFFPDPTLGSSSATTPVNRPVFRLVINAGALPNTAVKQVPHNLTITNGYTFTRIYGCSSDTTAHTYLPLPYASAIAGDVIELNVDNNFVNIRTGSNRTNYNVTYVILEYIKT